MNKLKKFLVAATICAASVVGVSAPAHAGLYGCKWWVTQTTGSPYYSTITAKATCQGVTPGGFQYFRLKGKCSDGTYIYDSWRTASQLSGIWGYSCFNAPTHTLTSISISYKSD